jgi:hypothetical protein
MSKPTASSNMFALYDVVIVPFACADCLAGKRRGAIVMDARAVAAQLKKFLG